MRARPRWQVWALAPGRPSPPQVLGGPELERNGPGGDQEKRALLYHGTEGKGQTDSSQTLLKVLLFCRLVCQRDRFL